MSADSHITLPVPPREPGRCTACGRCVAACPEHLLTLEATGRRKHARLTDPERCTVCGRCLLDCPFMEGDSGTGKQAQNPLRS